MEPQPMCLLRTASLASVVRPSVVMVTPSLSLKADTESRDTASIIATKSPKSSTDSLLPRYSEDLFGPFGLPLTRVPHLSGGRRELVLRPSIRLEKLHEQYLENLGEVGDMTFPGKSAIFP